MNTKSGSANSAQQDPGPGGGNAPAGLWRGLNHKRVIGLYLAGCAALAVIAAALLLSSCGGSRTESAAVTNEPGTSPVSESSVLPAMAVNPQAVAVPASMPGLLTTSPGEGLPPEIAIGEMTTVVAPGEPISLTMYGTPDVTEMSLSDGIGDPQAFVHDRSGDVWRVDYRVPLRPKQERIGLSVTARNDLGRWRRVWVFLQVASTAQVVKAEADNTEPDSTSIR
ncbi:MAG: hypothetical protein ABIS67_03260 [Candidatus Eisenbacteria bacterium]